MKKKRYKGLDDVKFIHKIICKNCGWYNSPINIKKRKNQKYYRCIKCGNELKTSKDDFMDNLLKAMEGGSK